MRNLVHVQSIWVRGKEMYKILHKDFKDTPPVTKTVLDNLINSGFLGQVELDRKPFLQARFKAYVHEYFQRKINGQPLD
jgi:hypothetical protein